MTNKYFEIAKKTTVDYIENRISCLVFKETFDKLDKIEIYKDLENNGYEGISNYISAVAELDDQSTLESQTIVNIINLFYCFFIDDYGHVCADDLYRFLKIGLSRKNKTPVKISFKLAIQDYLDKKIGNYCLAYIASEFLNNLKFFEKEIKCDEELFNMLNLSLKLKPTKLLENLTHEEEKKIEGIDSVLKSYI